MRGRLSTSSVPTENIEGMANVIAPQTSLAKPHLYPPPAGSKCGRAGELHVDSWKECHRDHFISRLCHSREVLHVTKVSSGSRDSRCCRLGGREQPLHTPKPRSQRSEPKITALPVGQIRRPLCPLEPQVNVPGK